MMKIIYKKNRRCPFCKSEITLKYGGLNDRLDTVEEKFNVFECCKCGLAFTNPQPVKGLGILYPVDYLSIKTREDSLINLEKWYRNNQYEFDFKIIKKLVGLEIKDFGSYLDIGCGSGERVDFVKRKGCKISFGLDKFDNLKTKKDNIISSDILKFKPNTKFKVVSLFNVLEHLENYEEVVEHIRNEILDENGYLIVQVPNYDCTERKFFKSKWFCFDVPRHLWHFRLSFLINFFRINGYRSCGHKVGNAFLHPVSVVPSIFKDIDIQRIWVKKFGFVYKFLWIFLTGITIPISFVENVFGVSSMLTMVLKTI